MTKSDIIFRIEAFEADLQSNGKSFNFSDTSWNNIREAKLEELREVFAMIELFYLKQLGD